MNNTFRYIIVALFLLLFQIAVLNNIFIANGITIFAYILLIIILPFKISRQLLLIIAFVMGFFVDAVFNTGGIHAFVTVFVAFIRPVILRSFENSYDTELSFRPGMKSMGLLNFSKFTIVMVFIHHLLIHFIEIFHFNSFFSNLLIVIINTILTSLVCIIFEALFKKEK